ncbi:TIGR04255 family protein [Neolewinella aurantiaca]|uniref:TIGR04255 family protein n=1 Tax=Neolewinella aurantiaca TaxID=2602767 RepID=A0A5C7FSB5_9BACT|nr:TIGR04255 family protein [Neolewinella aurantiaca]TXF89327.1 TIGR04255 family protein [Neolewinella aurantiaca]
MQRIPKSLQTPFLHDAIVELWFTPNVAAELLPGMIYERLRGDWVFPAVNNAASFSFNWQQISARATSIPMLTCGPFQLTINEGSVVFNVSGTYPGWASTYLPLLEKTLPKILEDELVKPTRTSIRYVNHIPTDDVFGLVNHFEPQTLPHWKEMSQTVRWVLFREGVQAVINLTSSQNLIKEDEQPYGIIDTALHRVLPPTADATNDDILNFFSSLHRLNKEILFGELLPEVFVEGFHPVYE